MFFKCFCLLLILTQSAVCQRRIIDGKTTNINATFVVYLVRAKSSPRPVSWWLCGGSLVDRWFVLTSAACLDDAMYPYVVAGYNKYVPYEEMEDDPCIVNTRKRIISWCYQDKYTIGEFSGHDWASADIALARVDEPFNFKDPFYLSYCSYLPTMVNVGFNYAQRRPGAAVIAYGWGHRQYARPVIYNSDYNSETLYYASTRIIPTSECVEAYPEGHFRESIKKYGICTAGPGLLNDEGLLSDLFMIHQKACTNDKCRRAMLNTRRQGICQNDHGGPLLTWFGGRQYVIGVATAYLVRGDFMCSPPFVFTSTACGVKFIRCMLSQTRRARECAAEQGVKIIQKNMNWSDYNFTLISNPSSSNRTKSGIRSSTEELLDMYD